jgi:acetolactate synthase-1/2/3 large subunit
MNNIDLLADEIYNDGVSSIFGIPGSGPTLSLIDSLESKGIPFYLTQFEGTGALMAATIGRLRNKAGVSLSIKGPGLTNAIPGIAAAWFESFPLVHLSEATPVNAPSFVAHKRINQESLCRAITKSSGYLGATSCTFASLSEIANSEVPGPVLLQLTENNSKDLAAGKSIAQAYNPLSKELRSIIQKSNCPIIIAGTLAVRKKWTKQLSGLLIPIFSTASAKGVVDENLPHAAGVYTGVGLTLTPESSLFDKCDLVIGLGLTAKEVLSVKPFNVTSINVEVVESEGTHGFRFDARLSSTEFDEIVDILAVKSWGIDLLSSKLTRLFEKLDSDFLPGRVFAAIQQFYRGKVRLVMDTGYFCTIGEHSWKAISHNWCLLSGQGRYMGTCIPMAIAASIYDAQVPTIAVVGDGGIGMYLSEIKLAVRLKLPLLLILMSDNSFGSIRTRAIKERLTQKALIMDGNSWVPVLNGYGVPGAHAENDNELDAALKSWDRNTGPAFIEISFNPTAYQEMIFNIR